MASPQHSLCPESRPRRHLRARSVLGEIAMLTEAIGWLSSAVLVVTIAQQVYKQWRAGTSKGVSRWLFLGQTTASAGFTLYSWLVHNWVFVVTNGLLTASALLGYAIVIRHGRRDARTGTRAGEAREMRDGSVAA